MCLCAFFRRSLTQSVRDTRETDWIAKWQLNGIRSYRGSVLFLVKEIKLIFTIDENLIIICASFFFFVLIF